MFPYSGNMSPAIPIDVTPVTNASSSSGQTPGGGTGINAPPSLALGSTAGLITAGDNAAGPVNLTNLVVTDDGIGINNLVSGSSLAEVAGTTLRIRAGVTLTPGVVNLPVYVIDYSLPNQPQGSATYQLTILQYELSILTTSLAEQTTTAPIVLATIVTSGYTGTSFSLSGTDAAIFELSGAQLRLRSGTVLDFEAATTKTVDVNLTSNQGSKTRSYSLAITNVNEAPVVASLTVTADTAVALNTVLATATANDPEEGNPATGGTWSITGVTGGSNALARFTINGGGQITNTVTPMSAGTDVLTVSYTDAGGLSSSNTVSITFGGTVVNGVTHNGTNVTHNGTNVIHTP